MGHVQQLRQVPARIVGVDAVQVPQTGNHQPPLTVTEGNKAAQVDLSVPFQRAGLFTLRGQSQRTGKSRNGSLHFRNFIASLLQQSLALFDVRPVKPVAHL